jgi:hypothetical protein
MPLPINRRLVIFSSLGLLLLGGLATGYFLLSRSVRQAMETPAGSTQPLQFSALPLPATRLEHWGGGEVEAVAATPASLLSAGNFGVIDESGDLSPGLPTLQVSALVLWRGHAVLGLKAGGLFLRRDQQWHEARTGFGTLHVRALLETPGGELLIGAQEGLFRTAWGANVLERLDAAPVRSIALGEDGVLLAGGEQGLRQMEGHRAKLLNTPDPWVDWVGLAGKDVAILTPLGLARGPLGGELLPQGGGEEATSAIFAGKQVYSVCGKRLLRFEAAGRPAEELPPAQPRKVFAIGKLLFVDTAVGLYQRGPGGWTLARPRPVSLPPGPCHVNALAFLGSKLVLGLFDGGLVQGEPRDKVMDWQAVPGGSAWAVNALLPAGGVLYVASLRGTARFDGRRIDPLGPEGAAFSLANTPNGVAIGMGQGLMLPDSRFLTAFHGLPGNQALALASGECLLVGTPSGLGAVAGSRVLWRVTAGDGKLPHPWITALTLFNDKLFVGTYGGGVARCPAPGNHGPAPATFDAFLETQGVKVNAGCLVEVQGRLLLGTDGKGLYRLDKSGGRFLPVPLPLPSPRITAILPGPNAVYIGTDEGLARVPLETIVE